MGSMNGSSVLAGMCLGLLCVATPAAGQAATKVSLTDGVAVEGDDGSRLQVGYLGWLRYQVNAQSGQTPAHGFALPVSRPQLTAAFPTQKLVLFTQAEMGGDLDSRLLDAELFWRPNEPLGLHIGYYRPHFSRSFRTGLPFLLSPGRGEIVDTFRPPRDLGVTATGVLSDGGFEYQVGVFNGPQDARGARHPRRVTARIAYNPMGAVPYTQTPWFNGIEGTRVSIGAQAMWANPVRVDEDGDPTSSDDFSAAADVTVFTSKISSVTEAHVRILDEAGVDALRDVEIGATTRFGYLIVPERFDVSGQLSIIQLARDDQPAFLIGAGGQWYIVENHAKMQVFYQLRTPSDPDGVVAHLAQVQAQLWF